MTDFIKVHYVGKELYDIQSFKKEAKKYGVSRALPPSIFKTLKWGERIYLAQYKNGKAIIFGYFVLTGLNYTGSEQLKQAVRNDERLIVIHETFGGFEVRRKCGSYYVGSRVFVDNEFKEVVEIILERAREFGESIKIFAAGRFYETSTVHVEDVPFSRSIVKVPVEKLRSNVLLRVDAKADEKQISHIYDYKQKRRLTRKDKAAFESLELTAFV